MVTMLHPVQSDAVLAHATHMSPSARTSPGLSNVGIGMGINMLPNLPGLIASPFGIGLHPNAYMPRMLDPNMVHAHTSLLLAAAYGQDSVPQVIATEPSNGDLSGEHQHGQEDFVGLKSPGVKLDEFDDMKVG
jgi:hypothetical protein